MTVNHNPTTWIRCFSLGLLLLSSGAAAEDREHSNGVDADRKRLGPNDTAENVVLDESAFFRSYYTFDWDRICPKSVKEEGEKFYGRFFRRLKKNVHRDMKALSLDPAKEDWMEHVYAKKSIVHGFRSSIASPPPPADWMKPRFDDGDWLHQRNTYATDYGKEMSIRQACFRAWFKMEKLEEANLSLDLVYRGGVRVFLNGQEINRAHLPEGDIHANTPAETYPISAYCRTEEELSDEERQRYKKAKPKSGGSCHSLRYRYLPGPWEETVAQLRKKPGYPSEKAWKRLNKERNRVLKKLLLPRKLLKKGSNLLAIAVHRSDLHPIAGGIYHGGIRWPHARLISMQLKSSKTSTVSGLQRPKGMQVWVRDPGARTYNTDYLEPGAPVGTIRLVGGRGGTYSSQVSVGSDSKLSKVRLQAGGLAMRKGKGIIRAENVRIYPMIPRKGAEMAWGGTGRNGDINTRSTKENRVAAKRSGWKAPYGAYNPRHPKVDYFGHIGWSALSKAPTELDLPAGTSRSFWLSLNIPPAAQAGIYQGAVKVSAEGQEPVSIPIELEVTAWRLPDPQSFNTAVVAEQSPYGVAKHYQVPLWSDQHFELMEGSFYHLSRLGNRWLNIPVILNTEYGNGEDTMISWTRRADGSLAFDYSILDRYLNLAVKYWGKPKIVHFAVMHGPDSNTSEVIVKDAKTAKKTKVQLSGLGVSEQLRVEYWGAFARSLCEHMRKRGLETSMCWGYAWDSEADPGLKPLLKRFAPAVHWARGGHFFLPDKYYRITSTIYAGPAKGFRDRGWRRTDAINLINPRTYNKIINIMGDYPPFMVRVWPDRTLAGGHQGIGRMGADYGTAYGDHFRAKAVAGPPGFSIRNLYYFGKTGAETSARAEALLEGIQETEARIFLEMAAEYGLIEDRVKLEIENTLKQQIQATAFYPVGHANYDLAAISQGWKERSRRLYRLAGKVSGEVGLHLDEYNLDMEAPALGSKTFALNLINMSERGRPWSLKKSPGWIQAGKTKGVVEDTEKLQLVVDTRSLKENSLTTGEVVIADELTKSERVLKISLKVGELVSFPFDTVDFFARGREIVEPEDEDRVAVFNVPSGGKQSRRYPLHNKSGSELKWKASSPAPWISIQPKEGTLKPGAHVSLELTASSSDKKVPIQSMSRITISGMDGTKIASRKLQLNAMPKYVQARLPEGKVLPLKTFLRQNRPKKFRSNSLSFDKEISRRRKHGVSHRGPSFSKDGAAMVAALPQEMTIDLKGKGIRAFSATVQLQVNLDERAVKEKLGGMNTCTQGACEIHVDGKIVATSGIMTASDQPRLLVVEGLENASELKLVSRYDAPEQKNVASVVIGYWEKPALHQ